MYEELDVKLNQYGNIDHEYYTRKAYQLRAKHTNLMVRALAKKIKALFSKELPRFHIGSLAHR